jgi:putative SOS response-associated peptidase YedK
MCNRYRPASVVRIRDVFGFTYIESGPPREYRAGIGPKQPGPYISRRDGLVVGQWALIPDGNDGRDPKRKNGSPMSTNNARFDPRRGEPEKYSFKGPWLRGQRCLVPAEDYDEPYYPDPDGKSIWWRFGRADGEPWMLAGLWNDWNDPSTGEIVPSYTMLTINCNAHPLLSLMHKPDRDDEGRVLPMDKQDKRSVVAIEREHWKTWLEGTPAEAAALIGLPPLERFRHGAADPARQVALPI